jgi:hypothetical protein
MNLTNTRENSLFTQIALSVREAKLVRNIRSILGAALLAACSSGTEPDPVKVLILTPASPTAMTVAAGKSVDQVPTVIAYDDSGRPAAGVVIVFNAAPGAGAISGFVDTTNSAGVAQLQVWAPGTNAGEKAFVTARAPNGSTVEFVASIVPAAPSRISKIAGDHQVALVQELLPINPSVRVTDAYGNPISGVQVKFGVTKGGGSVNPAVAVTDDNGIVSASSWTLGGEGEQILALDAGIIAQSFHATAVAAAIACSQKTELVPASLLAWQLTPENCSVNGKYFTIFYFTTATMSSWVFDMQSAAFDTNLELRDANSATIASSDSFNATNNSRIRAVIRPGTYQLVAAADRVGATGSFSLNITETAPVPSGCDALFVSRGDSTSSEVRPVTCNGVPLGNVDLYRMHLPAGERVQVHLRDLSYSGFELDIQTAAGTPLTAGKQGLTYLEYDATYFTSEDVDLVIRVSSSDSYAAYWITFK